MKSSSVFAGARWWLGGVLLLALLFGAAAPARAQAEFGHSTITLLAPGAPAGATASVQWLDQSGAWRDVAGWRAELKVASASGSASQLWAVYPEDYGRGPFRWVVMTAGGGVWATSANFYLPDGNGAGLTTTVAPAAAGGPVIGVPRANFSTITVLAPDAPEGAWVGVQWRDVTGAWHDVDGWQAPLEMTTGAPATRQFGVFERDYGRGPFRWIVYAPTGGAVFATSPRFFLPSGGGANLTMTVLPKLAVVPADELTAELAAEPEALSAQTSTSGLSCAGNLCDFSVISLSAPNTFAGSPVGVQWLDPMGVWHDVPTWQGTLDQQTSLNAAYQQWTLSSELRGRGPFRWVIYNQMGDALVGVTPSFTLPDRPGVNLNMTLPAADFSDITG